MLADMLRTVMQVFFIDPIHFSLANTNDGNGFEIVFPKDWVAKALPYVKVGLTVLKVAAVAGKLAGLPIPDVKVSAASVKRKSGKGSSEISDLLLRSTDG